MSSSQLEVTNSSLTVMKVVGITAMVLDHCNSFLNAEYSPLLFEIGRLALPLFIFVLGYNLARMPVAKMPRLMLRLLVFGSISTPFYNMLSGGLEHWWPLNILFTLLVATTTVYLLSVPVPQQFQNPVRLAGALFFIAACSLVDYFWVGPGLAVVLWRLFAANTRQAERRTLQLSLVILAMLLCLLNDSLAALLAVPVILLCIALCQQVNLPRMKWFFYWFYPGHLLVLLLFKG